MEADHHYWEARARSPSDPATHEWYTIGFSRLRPALDSAGALEPAARVLEVGCGTSCLAEEIASARAAAADCEPLLVYAGDYSETCIRRQKERQAETGSAVEFSVFDARLMNTFEDRRLVCVWGAWLVCVWGARDGDMAGKVEGGEMKGVGVSSAHQIRVAALAKRHPPPIPSIDVLVDKATLDACDCVDDGAATSAVCAEMERVLRPGGFVLIVTARPPRRRLESMAACQSCRMTVVRCEPLR